MSTIVWPDFRIGTASYSLEFDVQLEIARSGRVTTYGLPGARWRCSINFEPELETMQRPAIEALIARLEGGANRLQLGHLGRPLPNGTMAGSPTLAGGVSAGAKSVLINTTGTLKAGDLIGIGGQLVMITQDATPVSSVLTAIFTPGLRAAATTGAAVVWNKPTTLWIPTSPIAGPFPYIQNKVRPGFGIELVEAWA